MPDLKKKIYVAIAVLLFVWPVCQHALVRTHAINPWRFFGWAMYAVPSPTLRISHHFVGIEEPASLKHQALYKNALKDFSQRRAHWGDLEKPQELADVLFSLVTDARELRITISKVFLDTDTAMLQERKQTYTFNRSDD